VQSPFADLPVLRARHADPRARPDRPGYSVQRVGLDRRVLSLQPQRRVRVRVLRIPYSTCSFRHERFAVQAVLPHLAAGATPDGTTTAFPKPSRRPPTWSAVWSLTRLLRSRTSPCLASRQRESSATTCCSTCASDSITTSTTSSRGSGHDTQRHHASRRPRSTGGSPFGPPGDFTQRALPASDG